jgi:chromosome segregation ATPase
LLMAHFLLGCEISRLTGVIKQYEQNLVSLNKDLDDSLADNDELREEIQQLKRDMQKVVEEDGRFKNSLMNLQKNNNELSSRLDEETKKNILLNHQLTALANNAQSKPAKEEPASGNFNLGLMDFMNDDKNSLVQQLVRRNLENDKLRREIEFFKLRIPPVNTSTLLQAKTDSERTKELLRCIGNSFFNNQDKGNPMIYDLELIKIKAEGLVGKVDERDRPTEGVIKDRTNSLVHSIKSLHMEDEGAQSYEKDRDSLFKNIEELIKKLCSPKIGTVMNSVSNQGYSPGKPSSQHFGAAEEFRTEVINGVPVKVKVIRRDPRSEQTGMNNENVNTLNTKQDISAREAQNLKVELGRALKKVSELENQNQLLLSKIDKYIQGNKQLSELGGDQPSYKDAPTSNIIAIEELRAQVFGLKNEIHDLKLRMEQGRMDRERIQLENDELQERLGYHAREVDNLKKREQECNNQLIQANNEKNHVSINLRAAESEVAKLRSSVPLLEEKLEKAEFELRSIEKSLNAKLNEALRKVDEREVLVESLKRNLGEKQNYIAGLERKQDDLEEVNDGLKSERDSLLSKLTKSLQECEDSREKGKEQMKEIKRLNEELSEMDSAMHLMKSKIMDLQSQKEGHLKAIEDMKKNEQDLIEELVECKSQNAKLQSTVEQKETSLADANRANNLLTLKQQKTLDLLHQLKKSVEKIKLAFENELLDVKKRLHKGKEDQDKYINSLSSLLQTQAELNPRGTLASLKQSRAKLAEIPKLMNKITNLDGTARQKQEDLLKLGEDLRKDIQQLERNLESAEDKIRQLQKELVQKENALELVTESSKRHENLIPRLKGEIEDCERQRDKLNDEIKRMKTSTDFMNTNIDNLTQENRLLRSKIEKKERQIEDLEDEMENQKKKIETVTKQYKNLEETSRPRENPFHNTSK